MSAPKISVCIPAYNRAVLLPALLRSIFAQQFQDFEVVIAEDESPERMAIRNVSRDYAAKYPRRLTYVENPSNLGYDGNLRRLFELARGEYVLFMGNDDIMCTGALTKVADALNRHQDIGVLLRSYAAFDGTPDNVLQTCLYFDRELFFPAGAASIATIYRRSVVIPGMVIHRGSALRHATDRFDGTLLYQLYLVAEILAEKNAVFLPDVIVLYRNGGTPDFGNSAAEQGKFEPKSQTPASSLHFIKGMLDIARYVEQDRGLRIYRPILRDIANYSYPLLAIQARQRLPVLLRYGWGLARMGFGRYPLFWCYWLAILFLGVRRMDALIGWIKRRLGRTPILGKVYQGAER
jgi:glycosyltransferase involved in cell wall biosynthesis